MADNLYERTHNTWCDGVNSTDNREVWFFYKPLGKGMRRASNWSRANNLNPTVLNTHRTLDAPSQYTDVVVWHERQNGKTICNEPWSRYAGWSQCVSLNGAGACQQNWVMFNKDATVDMSRGRRRELACHEFGHALGFVHHTGSCMNSNSGPNLTYFSTADKREIRRAYA